MKLAIEIILLVIAGLAAWKLLHPFVRGFYNLKFGWRHSEKIVDADLDPLFQKLQGGGSVTAEEIRELAYRPWLRADLYFLLNHFNLTGLLPPEFLVVERQAEAALAHWLMHPNEMREPPEQIEPCALWRLKVGGRDADFNVLRYRMRPGHPAAEDGWLLGVAGPIFPDDQPYGDIPAFSDFDKQGRLTYDQLLTKYLTKFQATFEKNYPEK